MDLRALGSYGHFTAMQVRAGATRGLPLHLARLDAANRELFGVPLAGRPTHRCGYMCSEPDPPGPPDSAPREAI